MAKLTTMNFEQYKAIDALHYSALSSLAKHPLHLAKEFSDEVIEKEISESMLLGSLVDCKILTPDEFDSRYMLSNVSKPGDKMGLMLDEYLRLGGSVELLNRDKVLSAATNVNYQRNWGPDTIYKKFVEECSQYLNIMNTIGAHTLVSTELNVRADQLVTKLLTNEYIGDLFTTPSGDISVIPQFFFKWSQEILSLKDDRIVTEDCKLLSDLVRMNHKHKLISPYDLKVIYGNPLQFIKTHFIKFNYYLQAAFYTHGMREFIKVVPQYADYTIDSFRFIVVAEGYQPMCWKVPDEWITVGLQGGYLSSGEHLPGVYALMQEFLWHKQTQMFEYPYEVTMRSGELTIPANMLRL